MKKWFIQRDDICISNMKKLFFTGMLSILAIASRITVQRYSISFDVKKSIYLPSNGSCKPLIRASTWPNIICEQ